MPNKSFEFDFNEDAEPVGEIHRLRVAMSRHFKTVEEHFAYLRSTPSAEEMIAQLQSDISKAKAGHKRASKRRSRRPSIESRSPALAGASGRG